MTKTIELNLRTKGSIDMVNITSDVEKLVKESGVRNGIALVFVPGATGSIVTIEDEKGLIEDFKRIVSELVPQRSGYLHNRIDNNAVSHLRATILGSERAFPIADGKLIRGTWQNIFFVELDLRPRNRRVIVQIVGD